MAKKKSVKRSRSTRSARSAVNGVTKAGKAAVKTVTNAAASVAASAAGVAGVGAGVAPSLTAKAPNAKNGFLDPESADFFKKLRTTEDVRVSDSLVDQIVGQERGRKIIRKAATQKRNVLLVGYPGTGKSMLAQAMAELLPVEELQDVIVKPNPMEDNAPAVEVLKAGEGRKKLDEERKKKQLGSTNFSLIYVFLIFISAFLLLSFGRKELGDVITAAMLIGLFAVGGLMMVGAQLGKGRMFASEGDGVKLLIDNNEKTKAPFIEATGSRAGSLLGDVRHDPFQCLGGFSKIFVARGKKFKQMSLEDLWRVYSKKYPLLVERREGGYEALALPAKEKIFVLGADALGKPIATRVFSLNRRTFDGEVVEVNVGNRTLVATPEHKFITARGDRQSAKLRKNDLVFLLEELGLLEIRRAAC